MGFFDRIFGNTQKSESPVVMHIREAEDWVKEKKDKWNGDEVESLLYDIIAQRDRALKVIEDIRDHEFPEDIKNRVFKPALTAKPKYVSGIMEGLSMIKVEGKDFQGLIEFHNRLMKALKTIQKIQLSHGKYIAAVYADQVPKLGTCLNRIIDSSKNLEEILDEEKERRTHFEKIEIQILELEKKYKEISKIKSEIEYFTEDVKKLAEIIKKKEKKKIELKKSEEYQLFKQFERELREIQHEKDEIKTRVLNILGPLSRIFRKYRKIIESGKATGDIKILDQYIRHPDKAFFSEPKGFPYLKDFIAGCKKATAARILVLDRKEREKLKDVEVLLRKAVEEFLEAENREASLKERISKIRVTEELKELETQIDEKKTKINKLKELISLKSNSLEELNNEISNMKKALEEEISKLYGKKIILE